MDSKRSRASTLVGLSAAVCAIGAAAMMSAATAPIARADDVSEILNVLGTDFALAQEDIGYGFSVLAGSPVDGLSSFFLGLDDVFAVAPENLLSGTVETLTNEPITNSIDLAGPIPTSFAQGLADAQSYLADAPSPFGGAATEFAAGDYGPAVDSFAEGADFLSIAPLQELILGVVASL